jgi:hypothetical protein
MTDLATSPAEGLALEGEPVTATSDPRGALDPRALAADFPILGQRPHGKRLV